MVENQPVANGGDQPLADRAAPDATADPAARFRRTRRRRTMTLVAALGAIAVALVLMFTAVYLVTAPRLLAERTIRTASGEEIVVRIVERGDRITGKIAVLGPDLRVRWTTSIDFPGVAGPSRYARIDYDADASELHMQVGESLITMGVLRQAGALRFGTAPQPMPQPRPAP